MLVSSFALPHDHPVPQQQHPVDYHDGPVFRACSSAMQRPTLTNVRIRSTRDANQIFYAVVRNVLPMTVRRLDAEERRAIVSGNVYVWEERGSTSEATGLGIERWTDGMRWSPSRVRDEFLFYHQKEMDPEEAAELPPTRWARIVRPKASASDGSNSDASPDKIPSQSPSNDPERLIKQTYSVLVDLPEDRHRGVVRKWHLTAYFTQASVEDLQTVDEVLPHPRALVPDGLFRSARVGKNRRDNGRARHSIGTPAGLSYNDPLQPLAGPSVMPITSAMTVRGAHPPVHLSPSQEVLPPVSGHYDGRVHVEEPPHSQSHRGHALDTSRYPYDYGSEEGVRRLSRSPPSYSLQYEAERVVYGSSTRLREMPLSVSTGAGMSHAHSRMHSPTYTHHPYLSSPRPMSRNSIASHSPRRNPIHHSHSHTISSSYALGRLPRCYSPRADMSALPQPSHVYGHVRHMRSTAHARDDYDDELAGISPIQRESEIGPARGVPSATSMRSRKTSLVSAFEVTHAPVSAASSSSEAGPSMNNCGEEGDELMDASSPQPSAVQRASSEDEQKLQHPPIAVLKKEGSSPVSTHVSSSTGSSKEASSTQVTTPKREFSSSRQARFLRKSELEDEENSDDSEDSRTPSPPSATIALPLPPITSLSQQSTDSQADIPGPRKLLVPLDTLDGATYPRRDPTDDALLRRFNALRAGQPVIGCAGEE